MLQLLLDVTLSLSSCTLQAALDPACASKAVGTASTELTRTVSQEHHQVQDPGTHCWPTATHGEHAECTITAISCDVFWKKSETVGTGVSSYGYLGNCRKMS